MARVAKPLCLGFAKVDITPPLTIPYLSFYPRQTPFEGVHDRLFARAVAAESRDTRLVIVSADALGFSRSILGPGRDFIGELRERIERATGIPPSQVLITATHAHSTPQTTDLAPLVEEFPHAAEWLDRLMDQLAAAAAVAWSARQPAELHGLTGLAPGIAWNRRIVTRDGRLVSYLRRPPDDQVIKEPRDDRVPVILAKGDNWRGAIMGFTCHPVTVQVQPQISADYPGVACALVERELGAQACVFLQGACADINPLRATTDFRDVALYGRGLGGEAIRALSLLEAPDLPPMRPALATGSERVALERRPLPESGPLEQELARRAAQIQGAANDLERREAITAYRKVAEPWRLTRLGTGPLQLEVQTIRLGDALIVAVEGELFVDYGNRIKDSLPAALTLIAAYSNGYEGYIPTPAAFDEGGYETSIGPWTRIGRTGGDVLTERALALARRVWDEGEQV